MSFHPPTPLGILIINEIYSPSRSVRDFYHVLHQFHLKIIIKNHPPAPLGITLLTAREGGPYGAVALTQREGVKFHRVINNNSYYTLLKDISTLE